MLRTFFFFSFLVYWGRAVVMRHHSPATNSGVRIAIDIRSPGKIGSTPTLRTTSRFSTAAWVPFPFFLMMPTIPVMQADEPPSAPTIRGGRTGRVRIPYA